MVMTAIFTSGFMGMASLSLAMDKHYKQVIVNAPQWFISLKLKQVYLKWIGWIFLAIALLCCIRTWNFSIGLTTYLGLLTLIVGVLILLLSYRVTWIIHMSLISLFFLLLSLGFLLI